MKLKTYKRVSLQFPTPTIRSPAVLKIMAKMFYCFSKLLLLRKKQLNFNASKKYISLKPVSVGGQPDTSSPISVRIKLTSATKALAAVKHK